jgi:uncharacterized membrane protein YjgN (DUF898 family)
MQCPACGAENPDNAWQCACGNYFATKAESPAAPPTMLGRLSFHGRGGTLFGIYVVNVLLALVTLGVYYFWGKVKLRNYFYGQTEFEGDRFGYHGTGKELLVGALKAGLLFGGLYAIPRFAGMVWGDPEDSVKLLAANFLYLAGMLVLVPVAVVGSRRYRLSRTSWREIRFSFRGRAKELIRIFLPGAILTGITLGIYYPFFLNRLRAFLVSNCYFGSRSFGYDGKGSELFRIYALGVLLSVLTLGVYYFWFDAKKERYYWSHTSFATGRFRATVTGFDFLRLAFGYVFLLLVTLGLAWPWIQAHYARFRASKLLLDGPVDLVAIQQEALAASATGEGLADLVDVGLLDVDLGI